MTCTVLAAACYLVAAGAEIGGILLVVHEARRRRQELRHWQQHTGGRVTDPMDAWKRTLMPQHLRQDADDQALEHMLRTGANPRLAVSLLIVGVVLGTVGNFLSLSW